MRSRLLGAQRRLAGGDTGDADRRGRSNLQITDDLGLTQANVKSRVDRILTRPGLDNPVQAALLAHEAALLPADSG